MQALTVRWYPNVFTTRKSVPTLFLVLWWTWARLKSACEMKTSLSLPIESVHDDKVTLNTLSVWWGNWATVWTSLNPPTPYSYPPLFFFLTRQNRCRQPRANIPSFSFPYGKVPLSLPAWGKDTKVAAILDYSLERWLYLFQFSQQNYLPVSCCKITCPWSTSDALCGGFFSPFLNSPFSFLPFLTLRNQNTRKTENLFGTSTVHNLLSFGSPSSLAASSVFAPLLYL